MAISPSRVTGATLGNVKYTEKDTPTNNPRKPDEVRRTVVASDAAGKVGAEFSKQVSKTPSCYSPGTDSDYIVKVTDPSQVSQMQSNYNQAVSQYLDSNGVLGPEDVASDLYGPFEQ